VPVIVIVIVKEYKYVGTVFNQQGIDDAGIEWHSLE
jgi:hypothetical protein